MIYERTVEVWRRPTESRSESRWFPVKQTCAATFRGMRPLAKGDVTRCAVSRDKKILREASLAVRFIPRSVTAASPAADLEALAWGTRGSHEGVLGFDSDFEEPSKTPRTTFHGSPLDFNATCTHAYVRECVRRGAAPPSTEDRVIERSLGARVLLQHNRLGHSLRTIRNFRSNREILGGWCNVRREYTEFSN